MAFSLTPSATEHASTDPANSFCAANSDQQLLRTRGPLEGSIGGRAKSVAARQYTCVLSHVCELVA